MRRAAIPAASLAQAALGEPELGRQVALFSDRNPDRIAENAGGDGSVVAGRSWSPTTRVSASTEAMIAEKREPKGQAGGGLPGGMGCMDDM